MGWHRVARKAEVPEGEAIQVRVGEVPIALFNLGGRLYATHDTCTHAFACLYEGWIDGEHVECPLHQGRFHIPSGRAVGPPATDDLRTFAVRVTDEEVWVEVAD